jgi:adenosylcobyric acid synthase
VSARSIMVLGTSSHVGKSLLTAALCRVFARQGYRVAPFKAQNMSLNSAATVEGLEIGRAQAFQAEAAGIAPSVDMNPILIKPAGDMSSQIIVRGRIWGKLTASDYHLRRVNELLPLVRESYESLAAKYEVIILEGAGSPAEINLKQHDIVNMRMAEIADAACILVGDIDRGGVFASLLGTVELLDRDEQERIRGFVINKFRGDLALLEPGIRMMEDRLGKPCLGVLAYLHRLTLDEEDSLGLPEPGAMDDDAWLPSSSPDRHLRIAVIALPSFSNFTDFDALRAEPSVTLRFYQSVSNIARADVVILPGSKQTVDDLLWLRSAGFEEALLDYAHAGLVVGICGGMQMLGELIADPEGMEHMGEIRGLGLLPIHTIMQPLKVTSIATGRMIARSLFGQVVPETRVRGYEIHIGETTYLDGAEPFAELDRQRKFGDPRHYDGCIAHNNCIFGTYLHGIFDSDSFRHVFLDAARRFHRLAPAEVLDNWQKKREDSLDRTLAAVEESLDLSAIFGWAGLRYQPKLRMKYGEKTP